MSIIVASWNIEKNGESSKDIKKAKVNEFIDLCLSQIQVSILFLCEVHSSRVADYVSYIKDMYGGNYLINSFPGGHSNAYVVAYNAHVQFYLSYFELKHLNRQAVVLSYPCTGGNCSIVLAHFKSGQNGLTKDQIQAAQNGLEGMCQGLWAILGDMNWDFNNRQVYVAAHNSSASTCWDDQTHAKGSILDWCLHGNKISAEPWDLKTILKPEMYDMTGPDHKPIVFTLS